MRSSEYGILRPEDFEGGHTIERDVGLELSTATNLDVLRPDWALLAERSGSLFSTWEWAESWWRHLGRGQLSVVVCRNRLGTATAVLPLYRLDGNVFLLGRGTSDELGPVCSIEDRDTAASTLRQFLFAAPFSWDTFVGDDMPGVLAWDEMLGGRIVRHTASPVLHADGMDWQAFLSTKSANFRAQVRARERRLRERYRVVLTETQDLARLSRDLDALFRLHVARWGWAHAQKLAGAQSRAFLEEFAATALRLGWLRLRVLDLDGRPAAAMLNFRFGGSEWYYQGGRDPALARESVGFVLQAHAVREALNDGCESYRFLRGNEAYKRRFANDDAGVVTIQLERAQLASITDVASSSTSFRAIHPGFGGRTSRSRRQGKG